MKLINYLIILLFLLCLAGCKFDGSLRYEQYNLDASKAKKVSFDTPWSYVDAEIPPLEWVKICQNDGLVYVKIKGKLPRKYNFESPHYSIYCKDMEWGGLEPETGDYISGILVGVSPTTVDLFTILKVTNNFGPELSNAIAKQHMVLESNDENKWRDVLKTHMEINHFYEVRAKQYMPMLKNIIPFEGYCTMFIHIGNTQTQLYKHSNYNGWYAFPVKENNLYRNPKFPQEKKSYFNK